MPPGRSSHICKPLLALAMVSITTVSAEPPATPSAPVFSFLPMMAKTPPNDSKTSEDRVTVGRLLFFDPVLSATQKVACATCHHPSLGWADGRMTSIGVGGSGLGPRRMQAQASPGGLVERNAPTILNVAFNGWTREGSVEPALAPMFWDSRVEGLEAQALVPIRSSAEMRGDLCRESEAVEMAMARVNAIPEYRQRFSRAFQKPESEAVTQEHLGRAIADFERSLAATNSPFDRHLRGETGAMSALQIEGMRRFEQSGCTECHSGPMLSDYRLHAIGVPGTGNDARREFRTPTLRNLRHTAPYMHDGQFRTLREVLVFYEQVMDPVAETLDGGDGSTPGPLDPLLHKLSIRVEDFPAIEAFLDALNDDGYDRSVPSTVPSGLPVGGSLH